MSITVTCHECERRIALDERPINGKIICPTCRTLLSVDEEGDSAKNAGRSYSLTAVKRCPKCKGEMPPDAKICINCGYNFQTGKQTAKVVRVKEFYRSWTFGFVPIYFTQLEVNQSKKGERWVATTQHFFGISNGTIEVDLSDCEEIWTGFRAGFGVIGWSIMVLALLMCVVPGLFWWWFAFNKPNYTLQLPYRDSHVTLYDGWNDNLMREILETVCELKQLEVVRKS